MASHLQPLGLQTLRLSSPSSTQRPLRPGLLSRESGFEFDSEAIDSQLACIENAIETLLASDGSLLQGSALPSGPEESFPEKQITRCLESLRERIEIQTTEQVSRESRRVPRMKQGLQFLKNWEERKAGSAVDQQERFNMVSDTLDKMLPIDDDYVRGCKEILNSLEALLPRFEGLCTLLRDIVSTPPDLPLGDEANGENDANLPLQTWKLRFEYHSFQRLRCGEVEMDLLRGTLATAQRLLTSLRGLIGRCRTLSDDCAKLTVKYLTLRSFKYSFVRGATNGSRPNRVRRYPVSDAAGTSGTI